MKRMSRGGRLILCVILTAACLWAGWALGAGAEEKGTTVTGYFEQSAFARPEMAMSEDYVAWIPAYTVVTMEPVDGAWAVYTSPEGKRGYVRYGKLLPIPEYEAEAESYVYSGKPMDVRNLPSYDAQTAFRTEPYELLTVNGRIKGYSHVVREDGSEGYIVSAWAVKAEFTPTPIAPVVLCVAEETPVTDLQFLGAHRIGSLQPDRFYRAEAVSGNYYALTMDGQTGYVEILRTALCAFQGGNDRSFFTVPRVGGQTWMSGIETIYASAILPEGGADLYQTDGTRKRLEGGLRGYAYTACGAWVGAAFGDQAGYLRREEVQVQTGEMLLSRLRETDLSGGKKERSVFLDQAFRMVEEGNPFQARYNLLTGADIRSVLPLGVPTSGAEETGGPRRSAFPTIRPGPPGSPLRFIIGRGRFICTDLTASDLCEACTPWRESRFRARRRDTGTGRTVTRENMCTATTSTRFRRTGRRPPPGWRRGTLW